jgi:hypothetical protein
MVQCLIQSGSSTREVPVGSRAVIAVTANFFGFPQGAKMFIITRMPAGRILSSSHKIPLAVPGDACGSPAHLTSRSIDG